jgi:single-strand DNA-binding protein
MNKIILMGRLTKDPDIHYTKGDNPIAVARYSIAVDKKHRREDGITADYFNIVAFDWAGDFAARFLRKGTKVVVSGRVQTGTYDNRDGMRMPFFEVVAEEQEFAESKSAGQSAARNDRDSHPVADGKEFLRVPDDADELPFE